MSKDTKHVGHLLKIAASAPTVQQKTAGPASTYESWK